MTCSGCGEKRTTTCVYTRGVYHRDLCEDCLAPLMDDHALSSGSAGFDRRRQYEDRAQDTVQPYDAAGRPNSEFFRLYPEAASKTFTASEIEQVKRKL